MHACSGSKVQATGVPGAAGPLPSQVKLQGELVSLENSLVTFGKAFTFGNGKCIAFKMCLRFKI